MSRYLSEILRLENKLMQADQARDLGVFRELIADDAVLSTTLGTLMRKSDVLDRLVNTGELLFSRYERSELKLKECASHIVVNCLIELENSSYSGLYRLTRVWSQLSDGWKIISGNISARQELLN